MNKQKNLSLIILISFTLIVFYFYASMLKASMGSVAIFLEKNYNLNELQLSLLSSVFYLCAGLLKVPMGILVDKYGIKNILLKVILISSLGSLVFAYSNGFYGFLIARILMSISYASALLCAVKVISLYVPARLYALLVGFVLFSGYLGASFAGLPLSTFIQNFGLNFSFISIAIFGGILFIILMLNMQKDLNNENNLENLKEFTFKSFSILKDKQVIYLVLYTGIIISGAICIADLWGKLYLVDIYHIDKIEASFVSTTLIYLGISFGSLIWGVLHSTFMFGRKFLISSAILMIIFIVSFFVLAKVSLTLVYVIAFFIGVFASSKIICYELAKRYVEYKNLAFIVSLLAMSVTLGSFFVQTLVGIIETIAESIFSNQAITFSIAIGTLPILLLIAIYCASKIRPKTK